MPLPAIPDGRLRISEGLKKDVKGATKSAVEALGMAAAMTQNVPYINIVSGALAEFLKIQNEVDAYKSDWKAVMAIARQIKAIVDKVSQQCQSVDNANDVLPEDLKEPFYALEECLLKTIRALNACKAQPTFGLAQKIRVRAREYLNRGDLLSEVKECRAEMQAALDLFNTKLQIDQSFKIHAMKTILLELTQNAKHATAQQSTRGVFSLPSAPSVFHGRFQEVDHVVKLLLEKRPARVAILGAGGIGKTSIALTILHEPRIGEAFVNQRFFLSCEAVTTAEGVVHALLNLFGVLVDPKAVPRDILVTYLHSLDDAILCLDNLETPWDVDVQATEALLEKIAGLPRLALLITTRGADRPSRIAWTRPHLPPVTPIPLEAAIETWDAICDSHDDYSVLLIQAVDCVPLAVTLLAHLAQSESSEALWARWEHERTELLRGRGPGDRLNQVDISIQISLRGPRMRDEPLAIQFLSILCMLPQGLPELRVPAFVTAFADLLPAMRRSITTLRQSSLVYSSEDAFLRVLSPIRLYMLKHHPITDFSLLFCLTSTYRDLVDFQSGDFAARSRHAKKYIQPELVNITTIFRLSLTRGHTPLKQTLIAINGFSGLCLDLCQYDTDLLGESIAHAGDDLPAEVACLWQSKGVLLYFQDRKDQALPALSNACELHHLVGYKKGEAECLHRMGDTYLFLSRLDEALPCLRAAIELWSEVDDRRGLARTLRSLGRLYGPLGRVEEGREALQSALAIYDDLTDDDLGKASTLETLGDLLLAIGENVQGENVLRSSLEIYKRLDYRLGQAHIMWYLGTQHLHVQQEEKAEVTLRDARELYHASGAAIGEVDALNTLGCLYEQLFRYEEARQVFSSARDISIDIAYWPGQTHAWTNLSRVHDHFGEFEDAARCLKEAMRASEKTQGNHPALRDRITQRPFYVRPEDSHSEDVGSTYLQ
ncbi:hypothetical protein PENSPDRAFT_757269 [Peniophora sp. CONT]|nr:hypothetical protein PENSPDRAFT_757269 [Peniophora sp. CONT]